MASIKRLIRLPKKKGGIPERSKIKLKGKPITDIILEERDGDIAMSPSYPNKL